MRLVLASFNCKLAGYASPPSGVVVDACASGQICAVIDVGGDAGTTYPICMKSVECGSLSCGSTKCAENVETAPATKSCIKQ